MTGKRWKNPDKRMALAVELRRKGWSLRRIGQELSVTEGTIRLDLGRWERQEVEKLLRSHCVDGAQLRSDITQEGEA